MIYDAIVIGAGPSGSSVALALSGQGRAVAIVERSEFPRRKVCGEFMSAVNLDLLDRLGGGTAVRAKAGPEVKRVALFASGPGPDAGMPRAVGDAFGRALGRDVLDGILLDAARDAGADVFQPWRAAEITTDGDNATVRIESKHDQGVLVAPVVIAAHGSWEQGRLPTNLPKTNAPHDLFGFKAHFTGAELDRDLMPLLAFPGGYGGMVWADRNRMSLSCCIRRDVLIRLREKGNASSAAQAVHAHILASCPRVASTIVDATLDGEWLAAGPMRPGIRPRFADDIFRVGNLAGESHPIIAEGISMALQSGWLLANELARFDRWDRAARIAVGRRYSKAWNRQFATRIRVAALLARLASHPMSAAAMNTFVSGFPNSLTLGARLTGKTKPLPIACD
ncbi:NAD(P)/FAD-dependent oxidoreductase [Mesorhizobium sp. CA13]|uniref:NAD(P)/FAD-dependent oxidoreductase n=1 Tax=Mesorhizobium sp. CA13 TaxID=2876643 RepID=UPI001CCF13F2|nr:NAD(P)/FAD-dependent oxidoreductase [Mesorhizobium sp. CA13]MBZ9856975.1 NAD(P)/FAD-dependent oxidoreductase [Mesorhizobium sp. CA13]